MSTDNNIEKIFPDTLKTLSDLIAFKTVSGESNIDLIDYCEKKLSKLGATFVRTYDKKKKRVNLFATLNENSNGNKKGIIFSGHTDVVPASSKNWSSDPFIAVEKDNKVFGRGACDMKGFIACSLAFETAIATSLAFPNPIPT